MQKTKKQITTAAASHVTGRRCWTRRTRTTIWASQLRRMAHMKCLPSHAPDRHGHIQTRPVWRSSRGFPAGRPSPGTFFGTRRPASRQRASRTSSGSTRGTTSSLRNRALRQLPKRRRSSSNSSAGTCSNGWPTRSRPSTGRLSLSRCWLSGRTPCSSPLPWSS